MWAVAVYDLGISDADFWDLSFWQITALTDRYLYGQRREDQRSALIACIIANANRDTKKKQDPFTIEDFMPKREKQQPRQVAAKTWQGMHAQLLNWQAGFKAQQGRNPRRSQRGR